MLKDSKTGQIVYEGATKPYNDEKPDEASGEWVIKKSRRCSVAAAVYKPARICRIKRTAAALEIITADQVGFQLGIYISADGKGA